MNEKYLLKIYNGKTIYKGTERDLVINTVTTDSLKELKRIKKFTEQAYPEMRIVTKEKTQKGWVEINI